jgi:pyridoxamine 5'-phosphate oxidase
MSIANLRREYLGKPLLEQDAGFDPLALFARWFAEARDTEPDPVAMTLATADGRGRPRARIVLLKDFGPAGFVFYTNYESRKARDMAENPRVSLLFFWRAHERQVRVDGVVEKVSDAESDAYFVQRPIESRLSVYASKQSEPVQGREALDERFDAARRRFPGDEVPRPPWWGGYRVVPDAFEFWQGRVGRLHDRLEYTSDGARGWLRRRLAP